MNLRLALVLSLALAPHLAPAQEKAPAPDAPREQNSDQAPAPAEEQPPARVVVPASTEGKEALGGAWVLRNASLGKTVAQALQQSAGAKSVFEVGDIKGAYVATINLAENKIAAEWKDWQMAGTSRSERTGASELGLSVTGSQVYELVSFTDGKSAGARRWILKLKSDATKTKLTFRGFKTKSAVALPTLGNGLWTVAQDQLYLQSRGEVWVFDRQKQNP
jgi:hypothetical protein